MPPTPTGFFPFGDTAPAGPVSLQQLSSRSIVPALAAALNRSEGFEGGYIRIWEAGAGGQLHVELDQFSCATGAMLFGNLAAPPPPGTTSFSVTDGVSGATGFISSARDNLGNYREVIAAVVGNTSMFVTLYNPTTSTTSLEALAAKVAAHLQSTTST